MPGTIVRGQTPSLQTFLKSLKQNNLESSIELLIALLKRRQIRNPRACALATAQLLLRIISSERVRTPQPLIQRIRDVGRRLIAAQPREMAVGNIVRRVLGIVREISEDDQNLGGGGGLDTLTRNIPSNDLTSSIGSIDSSGDELSLPSPGIGGQPTFLGNQPPQSGSLFGLFQHPNGPSGFSPPPSGPQSPALRSTKASKAGAGKEKLDIKAEVLEGVKDLLDELDSADSQIADFALDHVHSNETILTHTASATVQRFLLAAAKKRKFTVFHAEAYPHDHRAVHDAIVNGAKTGEIDEAADQDDEDAEERWKPLTSMGIQVVLIPDSAVFALMSRIDKVLLAPHSVLADGSLLAAAGAAAIAQAAQVHRKPVVVLSGVYKLSPVYPFDTDELIEYGDPGQVVPYADGEFLDKVDVVNPVFDWVQAQLVDLYVTNLGGYAPSYLYQVIDDHYYTEDTDLGMRA